MRAWEVAELGLPWEVLREVERPSAVTPGGVAGKGPIAGDVASLGSVVMVTGCD